MLIAWVLAGVIAWVALAGLRRLERRRQPQAAMLFYATLLPVYLATVPTVVGVLVVGWTNPAGPMVVAALPGTVWAFRGMWRAILGEAPLTAQGTTPGQASAEPRSDYVLSQDARAQIGTDLARQRRFSIAIYMWLVLGFVFCIWVGAPSWALVAVAVVFACVALLAFRRWRQILRAVKDAGY